MTPIIYVIALAILAVLALLVAGGVIAIVFAVRKSRAKNALPQQPAPGQGVIPPQGYGQQPQHPRDQGGHQPR